ncbi:DUF2390 domain-containing protein [Marinobacter sp. 1Y8]
MAVFYQGLPCLRHPTHTPLIPISMTLPRDLVLDNPLWRAALDLWRDPQTADACLQLQKSGWSVTRILTAIWLTTLNKRWDGHEPEGLADWRHRHTVCLRELRQGLDKEGPCQLLREQVKAAELAAEKVELAWICYAHRLDCNNMSGFSGYNDDLLSCNLRAAAPSNSTPAESNAGMTLLKQSLAKNGLYLSPEPVNGVTPS